MQRIVLTGGPGAGKTTVLELLAKAGHAIGADAARTIIRERKAAGLSPRPEPEAFAAQILEREMAAYTGAVPPLMFFERGVADAAGFLHQVGGLDAGAAEQLMNTYRYDQVFLFPPWQEIYSTDAERDHSFEHAVSVCASTRSWYHRFGYELVEVPLGSPEERAEFVLRTSAGRESGVAE